jgi:predicted transcriptional regulator with HTH domain
MLAEFELSMRRSRKRFEVLIMLASLTESTPRALAQACGLDSQRLKWIMEGDGEHYSVELALVTLGLAEVRLAGDRKVYAVTERGRRKARQLTARMARKAIGRAANAARKATPHPDAPTAGVGARAGS